MKGGKTHYRQLNSSAGSLASMRPAREGRENPPEQAEVVGQAVASMRPAREGRENGPRLAARRRPRPASMRPAREGRENRIPISIGRCRSVRLQ